MKHDVRKGWTLCVLAAKTRLDNDAGGITDQACMDADAVISALVEKIMAEVEMQKSTVALDRGDAEPYRAAKEREKRAETALIDAIEPFMPDTDWRCYWP